MLLLIMRQLVNILTEPWAQPVSLCGEEEVSSVSETYYLLLLNY